VESTIVDCTGVAPRVLRPGSIGITDIEHATGLHASDEASDVRAPGGLAAHYAPNARVRLINESELGNVDAGVGLIAMSNIATPANVVRLLSADDVQTYAHNLYAALRDADQQGVTDVVAIAPEDNTGLADAIRDRLSRAAAS
jgi:L-threonylcarbamoyladenylate synthase